jgi:putative Mn2+ efflux pump MntP
MNIWEILIIALAVSLDALAVSISGAICRPSAEWKQNAFRSALFFGGFQAGMPLIGWFIGSQFAQYVASVDHWITFILLAIIGGKMIKESFEKEDGCCCQESKLNLKELTALAIATSIDALAVGVTFAFEYERNEAITVIVLTGIITAALSATGVFIGHKFGAKYKNKAELTGGLVLVLMGVKFLLEGLGIIGG